MFNLIMKDILVQKKTILFALGYGLLLALVFSKTTVHQGIYIMGSSAMAYLLFMGAAGWDDKSNTLLLINCLPTRRNHIVTAKYVTLLIFTCFALATMWFYSISLPFLGLRILPSVTWFDISAVILSMSLMGAFFLPLFFRFGFNYTRIGNVILFLLVFFAPNLIIDFAKARLTQGEAAHWLLVLTQLSPSVIVAIVTAFCVLLLAISHCVSQRVYRCKDL